MTALSIPIYVLLGLYILTVCIQDTNVSTQDVLKLCCPGLIMNDMCLHTETEFITQFLVWKGLGFAPTAQDVFFRFFESHSTSKKVCQKTGATKPQQMQKILHHLFFVILKKHLEYLCLQLDIFMGNILEYVLTYYCFDKEKRLVDCPTLLVYLLQNIECM